MQFLNQFRFPFSLFLMASVLGYFLYDYFEKKRVLDEREELIRLKTFCFVQRSSTFTLLILCSAYLYLKDLPGILVLLVMVLSSIYTEVAAKFYYRKTL